MIPIEIGEGEINIILRALNEHKLEERRYHIEGKVLVRKLNDALKGKHTISDEIDRMSAYFWGKSLPEEAIVLAQKLYEDKFRIIIET